MVNFHEIISMMPYAFLCTNDYFHICDLKHIPRLWDIKIHLSHSEEGLILGSPVYQEYVLPSEESSPICDFQFLLLKQFCFPWNIYSVNEQIRNSSWFEEKMICSENDAERLWRTSLQLRV